MESFRFCRTVRLKEAQKKMRPRHNSLRHSCRGSGSFASISDRLSSGTCAGQVLNRLAEPRVLAHAQAALNPYHLQQHNPKFRCT